MQLSQFSGRWGQKTLLIIGVLMIGFAARQVIFRQLGLGQSAQAQSHSAQSHATPWNGPGANSKTNTTHPTPADAFQPAFTQAYPTTNPPQYSGNTATRNSNKSYQPAAYREAGSGYPAGPHTDPYPTTTYTPQARNTLNELRNTPESQRDPAKLDALREELQRQFQSMHASQLRRLEQIMANAEQSKQILERRAAQRDAIVERRMAELLGQRDALAWDFPLEQGMYPVGIYSDPPQGLAFTFSAPANSTPAHGAPFGASGPHDPTAPTPPPGAFGPHDPIVPTPPTAPQPSNRSFSSDPSGQSSLNGNSLHRQPSRLGPSSAVPASSAPRPPVAPNTPAGDRAVPNLPKPPLAPPPTMAAPPALQSGEGPSSSINLDQERKQFEALRRKLQADAKVLQELNATIQALERSSTSKSALEKQSSKQQDDTPQAPSDPAIEPNVPLPNDAQNQDSDRNAPTTNQHPTAAEDPIPE